MANAKEDFIIKKIITTIVTLCLSVFVLCSCGEKKEVEMLRQEKATLETQIAELEEAKEDALNELKENTRYILVLEVKQAHFTLDIEIPIEVSKYQYHSVDIGDELSSEFRIGSAIFKGSFGSWDVTVIDKQKITE